MAPVAQEDRLPKAVETALPLHDPRWEIVEKVLASTNFVRSERLRNFLIYVCSRSLSGQDDEITEQQIGVHVFGRPADYNPGDDNVVRTAARLLRQKLDLYSYEEGQNNAFRIVIPKGTYVPQFVDHGSSGTEAVSETLSLAPPHVHSQQPSAAHRRYWPFALAAAVLVVGCVWFAWHWNSPKAAEERFWMSFFKGGVTLVSGDSGFVMSQNILSRTVHVSEYASGAYRNDHPMDDNQTRLLTRYGQRRYTSFPDLQIAADFAAMAGHREHALQINFARDLTTADLKHGNLILVGDAQGNPWVELFDPQLNFSVQMDPSSSSHTVINRNPRPGEQPVYSYSPTDQSHSAYALIALTSNLGCTGHVLLVEGTTMAGIDAAKDFLFHSEAFPRFLKDEMVSGNRDASFEILLRTQNIASSGPGYSILATRIH